MTYNHINQSLIHLGINTTNTKVIILNIGILGNIYAIYYYFITTAFK